MAGCLGTVRAGFEIIFVASFVKFELFDRARKSTVLPVGTFSVDVLALSPRPNATLMNQVEGIGKSVAPVLVAAPTDDVHLHCVDVKTTIHLVLSPLHVCIVALEGLLNS